MAKPPVDNETEKQDELFDQLRELLLGEERKKLHDLTEEVVERKKISARMDPIIDEKIEALRKNFPVHFGETITKTIKTQIRESQDEVIEALYPIMGKLIKKYIVSEIRKLSVKISASIKSAFSFKGTLRRIKNKIRGVSDGDAVLQDVLTPIIEEIFVIEKDSGLLVGNYSTENVTDKDMVSGMLTAIKSFAEEAFSKENQNLEKVDFETFQISLYNFRSIYIAIAISGVPNIDFSDELSDQVADFAEVVLGDRTILEEESKLNSLIKKHLIKEEVEP